MHGHRPDDAPETVQFKDETDKPMQKGHDMDTPMVVNGSIQREQKNISGCLLR
jgi:hypothetical protein